MSDYGTSQLIGTLGMVLMEAAFPYAHTLDIPVVSSQSPAVIVSTIPQLENCGTVESLEGFRDAVFMIGDFHVHNFRTADHKTKKAQSYQYALGHAERGYQKMVELAKAGCPEDALQAHWGSAMDRADRTFSADSQPEFDWQEDIAAKGIPMTIKGQNIAATLK